MRYNILDSIIEIVETENTILLLLLVAVIMVLPRDVARSIMGGGIIFPS